MDAIDNLKIERYVVKQNVDSISKLIHSATDGNIILNDCQLRTLIDKLTMHSAKIDELSAQIDTIENLGREAYIETMAVNAQDSIELGTLIYMAKKLLENAESKNVAPQVPPI